MTLEETDRQLILIALAHLAVERPGWDDALRRIAAKLSSGMSAEDIRAMLELT